MPKPTSATYQIDQWLAALRDDDKTSYREMWEIFPPPRRPFHTIAMYVIGKTPVLIRRFEDGWDAYLPVDSRGNDANGTIEALNRAIES